ncbi:MAG: guanylate kinase [Oligoflexia bacterium]|nr:guanylate kinase [Oligoflexia bacterium]
MTSKLIVISAPSGAGKTTLCSRLLRDFPQLMLSISSTTRAPRGRERDGVEYFFLSREEFERGIREDRFAEWAQVHGNYYGTSKAVIEDAFTSGKSVLLDIDVQGAASLRKSFPARSALFFISPPSLAELEKRLRARRTDSEESIRRRLANAKAEMDRMNEFDQVIVNDSLERAYGELSGLVRAALGASEGASRG